MKGTDFLGIDDQAKTGEFLAIVFLLIFGLASVIITGKIPAGEDAGETFMVMTLFYFVTGIAAYGGFVRWRELRLIKNTPTSKVRSMPMGTVEIKGTAEQGPEGMVLESPFSNEKCLFYKWMIQEYRDSGRHKSWDTIDQGEEEVRFTLNDGTGEVIIDPEGADMEMPVDNDIKINSSEDETEEIREFLKENSISGPGGIVTDNDRRYMEWLVKPGEEIYLFGYASNEKDEYGEYPIIKDDDRADMFIISDKSEKELRKSKSWKSLAAMFGGSIGVLALYASLLGFTGVL